jgi:hypothetical protein
VSQWIETPAPAPRAREQVAQLRSLGLGEVAGAHALHPAAMPPLYALFGSASGPQVSGHAAD